MPVPDGDDVCRFIRPEKDLWSEREQRPKPGVFKQKGISLWHGERLLSEYNVGLDELRIGSLVGAGRAHHTIADYHWCAAEAARSKKEPCSISAEWCSEDECVAEPWRQWREAHVQVDVLESSPAALREMRRLLAEHFRFCIPPDGFDGGTDSNLDATEIP